MPVICHLHQLDEEDQDLRGELSAEELGIHDLDELLRDFSPLRYDLHVQLLGRSLLARGSLRLDFKCECARCLKPFQAKLDLDAWNCLLRLDGEDAAPVNGDSVDLTPFIREDILLTLPQHPLCGNECNGLASHPQKIKGQTRSAGQESGLSPDWAELNKLKFEK